MSAAALYHTVDGTPLTTDDAAVLLRCHRFLLAGLWFTTKSLPGRLVTKAAVAIMLVTGWVVVWSEASLALLAECVELADENVASSMDENFATGLGCRRCTPRRGRKGQPTRRPRACS